MQALPKKQYISAIITKCNQIHLIKSNRQTFGHFSIIYLRTDDLPIIIMKGFLYYIISLFIVLLACQDPKPNQTEFTMSYSNSSEALSYLALGDSYTIGESVDSTLRWPVQLADSLTTHYGHHVTEPKIVATTGWTTDELKAGIASEGITKKYDMVSLLIGVNNQYRSYPVEQYEQEYEALLKWAIQHSKNGAAGVFTVSIPNYGVTPFGQTRGEERIRAELLEYDAKAAEICARFGIPLINITPISEEAKSNIALVADDDLHPSGAQYTAWVEYMLPTVFAMIEDWP